MSCRTQITKTILTHSARRFTFTADNDATLPYEGLNNLGLYVHIPFCRSLCSFCPYCKELYSENRCNSYVDSLIQEIHQAGNQTTGKQPVTSLYFGGGSPALAAPRLREIIDAIRSHFLIEEGIGVELHPSDVNEETLTLLQDAGVSKISIGIQSFQDKFLSLLGRGAFDAKRLQSVLSHFHFETVSMDFIFALPKQTFADLVTDIETAFSIGANHIAIYPFIPFSFASSDIPAMRKKEKKRLLDQITDYCTAKGYRRDSIWTFSNDPKARYSSMTRENFLGFGASATTLLRNQFKINTFSVDAYCQRVQNHQLPTALTLRFQKKERMVYFLFWMAYTTHVDPQEFERYFGVSLKRAYGFEFAWASACGFLIKENGDYVLTKKGAFYYHYYEQFYTLAYIDKMWGVLRKEDFPKILVL